MSETPSFGIKLTYPAHWSPELPYLHRSLGPDKPALMNFKSSTAGLKLAQSIAIGEEALVYVTQQQRFVGAIRFIGDVHDGEAARLRHGIPLTGHDDFLVFLPIECTARITPWRSGPKRKDVCRDSGVDFLPRQGESYRRISEGDYRRIHRAIGWS